MQMPWEVDHPMAHAHRREAQTYEITFLDLKYKYINNKRNFFQIYQEIIVM